MILLQQQQKKRNIDLNLKFIIFLGHILLDLPEKKNTLHICV